MDEHHIRFFDKVRLDISLLGDSVHGLFLHFLLFDGDPHVTVHGKPNPKTTPLAHTPHFTRWKGLLRRTLVRVAPKSIERFFEAWQREAIKLFGEALSPIDPTALEEEGWGFLEVRDKAIEAWIARHRKDGDLIVDEKTLVDLAASIFGEGTHHAPTRFVAPPGRLVAAVRLREGAGLPIMQVAHFPSGYGVEREDGEIELAHPAGWYRIVESWWPDEEKRAFFERYFGERLDKVRRIVTTVERLLTLPRRPHGAT